MNWRAVWAIARKDLMVVRQNRGVWMPMVIVPALFLILIPVLAGLIPQLSQLPSSLPSNMEARQLLALLPPELLAGLEDLTDDAKIVALILNYFLAPLYLIVPMMVASVVAADSFAGEKERKTLEAILYTPTTDAELFLAKLLAPWLPAIAIAWVGFLVLCVTANLGGWLATGRLLFPSLMWVVLAIWVAPAVAGLALGFTVLVSARARSFQEAYQLGAMVVLPLVALVIGQATGVVYLSVGLAAGLGLALWLIDLALMWFGGRAFKRGEWIARL
jgi:ABC-type Na+ efflux pump permease subunit